MRETAQLRRNGRRASQPISGKIFQFVNGAILFAFGAICLIPFLNVLGTSLASSGEVAMRNFIIIPRDISFSAYKYVLSTPTVFRAMGVSVTVTFFGTIFSMMVTSTMAYALSRRYLKGRRVINFLVVFTMLFNGGMIPLFLVVNGLGLIDSLYSLILPSTVNAYNLIIMRNFFSGIPDSLEEAARIDGANDFAIFWRIMLPLSKASLATISLFYAVGYWNIYQSAILYINRIELWPMQVLLRQIVLVASGSNFDVTAVDVVPPAQSVKMAVIMVATLPMLILYPFAQRYFVKGATLGSVKG